MNHHFRSYSEQQQPLQPHQQPAHLVNNSNPNNNQTTEGNSIDDNVRIHSDTHQSLERLFDLSQTTVPLRNRNLPASFFNPSWQNEPSTQNSQATSSTINNYHQRNYSSPAFVRQPSRPYPQPEQAQPNNNSNGYDRSTFTSAQASPASFVVASPQAYQPQFNSQNDLSNPTPPTTLASQIPKVPSTINNYHQRNYSSPVLVRNPSKPFAQPDQPQTNNDDNQNQSSNNYQQGSYSSVQPAARNFVMASPQTCQPLFSSPNDSGTPTFSAFQGPKVPNTMSTYHQRNYSSPAPVRNPSGPFAQTENPQTNESNNQAHPISNYNQNSYAGAQASPPNFAVASSQACQPQYSSQSCSQAAYDGSHIRSSCLDQRDRLENSWWPEDSLRGIPATVPETMDDGSLLVQDDVLQEGTEFFRFF